MPRKVWAPAGNRIVAFDPSFSWPARTATRCGLAIDVGILIAYKSRAEGFEGLGD